MIVYNYIYDDRVSMMIERVYSVYDRKRVYIYSVSMIIERVKYLSTVHWKFAF